MGTVPYSHLLPRRSGTNFLFLPSDTSPVGSLTSLFTRYSLCRLTSDAGFTRMSGDTRVVEGSLGRGEVLDEVIVSLLSYYDIVVKSSSRKLRFFYRRGFTSFDETFEDLSPKRRVRLSTSAGKKVGLGTRGVREDGVDVARGPRM